MTKLYSGYANPFYQAMTTPAPTTQFSVHLVPVNPIYAEQIHTYASDYISCECALDCSKYRDVKEAYVVNDETSEVIAIYENGLETYKAS